MTPASSSGPGDPADPVVEAWGEMREVLRDGHTAGRVALSDVLGPHSVAVGASSGLAAEITVIGGEAWLAEVVDPSAPDGLRVRAPADGEQATLLVLANVSAWTEHALPELIDLARLEATVSSLATEQGLDLDEPFPFRVEGVASELHLHVLDHSCPIADPDGPPPWRFEGANVRVELVGFYAEDEGGRLTHHGQRSHTHALLRERRVSGHLDEVAFPAGARLFLPERR